MRSSHDWTVIEERRSNYLVLAFNVGLEAARFLRLGAAAIVLGITFLGFFSSRRRFSMPLAMIVSIMN